MDDDDGDSHSQNNHGKGIVIPKKKTHSFAINTSKGGGIGIGVGIILVGGAFLVNYFFLNKPPKKPTNNKNHSSSCAENTDIGTGKAIGSGVSKEISAHNLFEDGDHKCDVDDQDITSCSKDSENEAMECNGSVVETDKLSLSAITDPLLLHQLTREEADVKLVSCIEANGGLIDHGDQENDHNDLLNLESIEDLKMNEFPEAVHEENVCRYSDGSLNIKEETNATFEAEQGDEDKINIAIQTSEGKGTQGENQPETPCPQDNTPQYDGLIDEVHIDGAQGLLTTSDGGVFDENELLEEPKSGEESKTPILEEKEADFEVETNAETEGIEENKPQDSAIYNTAGEVVVDEEETQLDVHTNGVGGEAAETDSSIEHTSKLMEYHHVVMEYDAEEAALIVSNIEHTSELVECQVIEGVIEDKEDINSGSKKSSELIEIQSTDNILPEENDQSISSLSESSILLELNPTTGLIIDSKDVGIDLHSIDSVTEKDIIYQETLIADNVDEISEGSLVEAKDQTDKLQDKKEHVTLQETENEIHYKEIEDDDAISSENIQTVNIQKGASNMNFFKKYMAISTQQKNDEKTSLLMRKSRPIVIGTMSALLCYSCLIAVLAMVLYKIQSF